MFLGILNKFFDPSTPSMRKGRDGGKKTGKKNGKKEKTHENSDHYVIASSRPPKYRTLVLISKVFQESCKGVSSKIKGCFK